MADKTGGEEQTAEMPETAETPMAEQETAVTPENTAETAAAETPKTTETAETSTDGAAKTTAETATDGTVVATNEYLKQGYYIVQKGDSVAGYQCSKTYHAGAVYRDSGNNRTYCLYGTSPL